MASFKFNLKDRNATYKSVIMLTFNYGKRLRLSTGISISPNDWDDKRNKVKRTATGNVELNSRLSQIEQDILDIYHEAVKNKISLSNDHIKAEFKKRQNGTHNIDFHQFLQTYMKEAKKKLKYSTFKGYVTFENLLADFEKETKTHTTFATIDLNFYYRFIDYCEEKNYSVNYIGKLIKMLKSILNEATERGLNKNLIFQSKKFIKPSEKVHDIYLSEDELDQIFRFDFSDYPKFEIIRDLFIVGCYTGLRFQDFSNIRHEHIKDDLITIKTQKTGELVALPIHQKVQFIIDKYEGKYESPLPPSMTNQATNRHLKTIGEMVGIDDEIIQSITKGGQRVDQVKKKYELISTHTARRSFATNAYLAGLGSIEIMKLTGHKTESAFLRYIKISQEENARKLMNHPFFKPTVLKKVS
jgi:integrase